MTKRTFRGNNQILAKFGHLWQEQGFMGQLPLRELRGLENIAPYLFGGAIIIKKIPRVPLKVSSAQKHSMGLVPRPQQPHQRQGLSHGGLHSTEAGYLLLAQQSRV